MISKDCFVNKQSFFIRMQSKKMILYIIVTLVDSSHNLLHVSHKERLSLILIPYKLLLPLFH